tara:strand:+ start:320 stop:1027 length:708 start_codon:yes stop_codon:yes gene_type:complete
MFINKIAPENKYFKQAKELLELSPAEIQEIKAYKKRTGLLKNGNKKLGRKIYAFDLPAVVSCPDYKECFKTCYANKGTFIWKSTRKSNEYNFAIALHDLDYLQAELIAEIIKKKIKTIRIHSSGDFFSKEYFLMWVSIANRFPELKIFTYSKAPAIPELNRPLNLNIIDSFIDYKGSKILNYGSYEALKPIAKNIRGLICPITKGQATNNDRLKALTCSDCKYCITKSKPLFVQH